MARVTVLGRPVLRFTPDATEEPLGPLLPLAAATEFAEYGYAFWGDGACGAPVDDDDPDSPWWVWVAIHIAPGSDPYDRSTNLRLLPVSGVITRSEDDASTLALEAARRYAEAYGLITQLSAEEQSTLRGLDLEITTQAIDTVRAI